MTSCKAAPFLLGNSCYFKLEKLFQIPSYAFALKFTGKIESSISMQTSFLLEKKWTSGKHLALEIYQLLELNIQSERHQHPAMPPGQNFLLLDLPYEHIE